MPIHSTHPLGESVGGVSERAGVRAGGSNPSAMTPSRVVTVEGILVFWKAALFAGRRRNEGLGRSVALVRVSPRPDDAPMTADVRRTPRRGTSSRMRSKRMHPMQAREIVACARETRPSLGPSTRARRSSLHTGRQKRHVVRRLIRHHGWANLRKREEPTLGSDGRAQRGSPRATASARERRGA